MGIIIAKGIIGTRRNIVSSVLLITHFMNMVECLFDLPSPLHLPFAIAAYAVDCHRLG
jgi:hypothetical protein